MATNLRQKIGVFSGRIFVVALPFRNGLEYRNGDGQARSARGDTAMPGGLYARFVSKQRTARAPFQGGTWT